MSKTKWRLLRRARKTIAQSLQAFLTQDTDISRHRRQRRRIAATVRGGTRASRAYRPTSLPRFALVGFLIQQLAESVQPSFAAVTESRKSTESGRKAAESWASPRTPSPLRIIAFFGYTNYINHAQIRYVCAIKHSPSGATHPRVSCFILYTYLRTLGSLAYTYLLSMIFKPYFWQTCIRSATAFSSVFYRSCFSRSRVNKVSTHTHHSSAPPTYSQRCPALLVAHKNTAQHLWRAGATQLMVGKCIICFRKSLLKTASPGVSEPRLHRQ